jgi:hypothetical protein
MLRSIVFVCGGDEAVMARSSRENDAAHMRSKDGSRESSFKGSMIGSI